MCMHKARIMKCFQITDSMLLIMFDANKIKEIFSATYILWHFNITNVDSDACRFSGLLLLRPVFKDSSGDKKVCLHNTFGYSTLIYGEEKNVFANINRRGLMS